MPPSASDRALRRLVAELAGASNEDLQEILSALEPGERRSVEDYLASYVGAGGSTPPSIETSRPPLDLSKITGLSPWLAARLRDTPAADADIPEFAMTPTALEALRASAALMPPDTRQGARTRSERSNAWWNRLGETIVWKRGAS